MLNTSSVYVKLKPSAYVKLTSSVYVKQRHRYIDLKCCDWM